MAMITGSSVHGNALMRSEDSMADGRLSLEHLTRFYLVMSFADRMLDRGILTVEEYADFAAETAESLSIKMPQIQGICRADNLSAPRHNEGWNPVHDGGD